jgi:hypothetical protein
MGESLAALAPFASLMSARLMVVSAIHDFGAQSLLIKSARSRASMKWSFEGEGRNYLHGVIFAR